MHDLRTYWKLIAILIVTIVVAILGHFVPLGSRTGYANPYEQKETAVRLRLLAGQTWDDIPVDFSCPGGAIDGCREVEVIYTLYLY